MSGRGYICKSSHWENYKHRNYFLISLLVSHIPWNIYMKPLMDLSVGIFLGAGKAKWSNHCQIISGQYPERVGPKFLYPSLMTEFGTFVRLLKCNLREHTRRTSISFIHQCIIILLDINFFPIVSYTKMLSEAQILSMVLLKLLLPPNISTCFVEKHTIFHSKCLCMCQNTKIEDGGL